MAYEEYARKIEYYINNIPKRIYKPVQNLEFEGFFTYERLSLKDALSSPRQALPDGLEWGRKWEYGWFFTTITIPSECKGKKVIFEAKQGESVVYVNGKIVGAFDKEHTHITLVDVAKGGEHFDIVMEAYAGHDGLENTLEQEHNVLVLSEDDLKEFPDDVFQKKVKSGSLGIMYDEVFGLWMDVKVLYDLRSNLDVNSLRRAKIEKALADMCDTVNIEAENEVFLIQVRKAREILRSVTECKNGATAPTVYAIGHSHLDLEWLWTREETRRKIARTLGNQLRLMEEYDDYKYIQTQPWLLETLKNEYPSLYEEVKVAVADSRIIPEGGSWVEPDTNIPSGESLIRQFMFGKKFIKDEFGKDSEIFWLPDSFGMSGSLPQILKGCGIKYFMNAKVMWQYNGGDELPCSNFMWQGIDGSRILSNLTQEYAVDMTPSKIFEKWNLNREKAEVPAVLTMYGHGDGGGGATQIHLEYLKRERDLEGMPRVIPESPNRFFEFVNECEINETYVGEIYYAAHRGTYTSQAKTKLLNRRSEFALREAEMWSALLKKDTKKMTDKMWKKVLFNQFHDILPGTSISAVYKKTESELSDVVTEAGRIVDDVFADVLFDNKNGEYITVANSLSHKRQACVKLPAGYTSVDGCKTERNEGGVVAMVKLPSCGMKSYKLGNEACGEATPKNDLFLENNLIKAEFNEKGELVGVIDKESGTEFLSKPSNIFKMYQNKPAFFDAWDIDGFYKNLEIECENNTEITGGYDGELESALMFKRTIGNSVLKQKAVLRKDSRAIDFETEIEWNETHKLLKVDFNTDIFTESMMSEVQFGFVNRPNHRTRAYDKDRFEVCNHKWSALCETNRGVAVINDCKYGISADNEKISLTLLNSSAQPARTADRGVHKFTYSFMVYTGNFAESGVKEKGYELNCPVGVRKGYTEECSFLNLSDSNVVIDTVKLAEDGSGDLIVRMYEAEKMSAKCRFECSFGVKSAYITNMLEEHWDNVKFDHNGIELKFRPFEVKTLRLSV